MYSDLLMLTLLSNFFVLYLIKRKSVTFYLKFYPNILMLTSFSNFFVLYLIKRLADGKSETGV